jgi:hypothetical protein
MKRTQGNKTGKSTSNPQKEFTQEEIRKILLNSISEDWRKIRTENNFDAEYSLLQFYAKKNQNRFYTKPFDKDLNDLLIERSKKQNITKTETLILPHLKNHLRYPGNTPKAN